MDDKNFYIKLTERYSKRFEQYEELIDSVNAMTDNCNIIRTHNKETTMDYINFVERKSVPSYNKKKVDRNITDVILLIAGLEAQIKILVDHKNVVLKELTGTML